MAAPDPAVVERQMYVDMHLNGVDDPSLSLADLRDMGAGGVNAWKAAVSGGPNDNFKRYLENLYPPAYGKRGVARTIYVRSTGSDVTGDGKAANSAFREIKTAVQSIDKEAPVFRGSITIDVGAGTYKGGIQFPPNRGPAQDDYIKIKGPAVGGHPNVPTAIIDKTADASATYGILSENGVWLWLEDILVQGAFTTAVDIRRFSVIQRRNLHVYGPGGAVGSRTGTGVSLNSGCLDFIIGGIVQGWGSGVAEMFNTTRSYDIAGSTAAGQIVQNCDTGVYTKANGNGHFDYITVQDCQIGIQLDGSRANMGNVTLKRNNVAIALKSGAEIHQESGAIWGSGVDANVNKIISYVGSSESDLWGWGSDAAPVTLRTGLRELYCIYNNYNDFVHTGTLTRTTMFSAANVLPADRYKIRGKRFKLVATGSCTSATTADHIMSLSIAGTTQITLTLPTGRPSGTHFMMEFEVIATSDTANTQRIIGRLFYNDGNRTSFALTTADLTLDRSVLLQCQLGIVSDTLTFRTCEVYG